MRSGRTSVPRGEPPPLPEGFRVRLDPATRVLAERRLLLGGRPLRLLRLSDAGRDRLDRLLADGVADTVDGRLARRLLDAGQAQPVPARIDRGAAAAARRVTVIVPVRDRGCELDRCLAALAMPGRVLVVDDGSRDSGQVAQVARRHGARLVRRDPSGGPAAARNLGVSALADEPDLATTTDYVGFVDSDTVVACGWLESLLGHFADPAVGAVAPRVRARRIAKGNRRASDGLLARFGASRSPLDMGERPAEVRPGAAVGYLPTAALLARRDALERLGPAPFDAELRYGEDVDLLWRLHDAGWRIRYEPLVAVQHDEPVSWRVWLRRRYAYGTSAGPLACRHPGRLPPLRVPLWPALAIALAAAGRATAGAAVAGGFTGHLVSRLQDRGLPAREGLRLAGTTLGDTARSLSRGAAQLALPAVAGAGFAGGPRRRLLLLTLLALDPLACWWERRPELDPLRWTVLSVLDDAAYGAGVWRGALAARRIEPILPRIPLRCAKSVE